LQSDVGGGQSKEIQEKGEEARVDKKKCKADLIFPNNERKKKRDEKKYNGNLQGISF